MEYPLADEYTVGGKAQLDRITVSDLTRELEKNEPSNAPQPARESWARKISLTHEEWKHVASLYTLPLLKHTDKHLHFKPSNTSPTGDYAHEIASPQRPRKHADYAGNTTKARLT